MYDTPSLITPNDNGATQHVKKIVLSADELLIVEYLNEAVAAHPKVTFGSYPYVSNPAFKTVRNGEMLLQGTGYCRGYLIKRVFVSLVSLQRWYQVHPFHREANVIARRLRRPSLLSSAL